MKIRLFTIPNMLTLANLFCGCMAILYLGTEYDLQKAFIFIVAAAIFDFADGFAARMLGSYSEVGKQLDSLADMVSFGVAPSMTLYVMYILSGGLDWFTYGQYIMFIVALFSALRLAKFNIDETQHEEFSGLPTPACTLFISSTAWVFVDKGLSLHPAYIIISAICLSYLLISPVRMFALKFKSFGFRQNSLRYIFMVCSLLGLIFFRITAVPFIILGYIITSVVRELFKTKAIEG